MSSPEVVFAGQVARDLVLLVDEVPGPRESAVVRRRREMLGGKGANQAVGCAQLGLRAAVIGVVGDDDAGAAALDQARRDGVDVTGVVRRSGVPTALLVDVVDAQGRYRYLEDVPDGVLLTEADIAAAAGLLGAAKVVALQLQQPAPALLAAARRARDAGALLVLDGTPPEECREELLALAGVLRADTQETGLLCDGEISDGRDAAEAARQLRERGPDVVLAGAADDGNVLAWSGGTVRFPRTREDEVTDTTGTGDAMVAALVARLHRGDGPVEAGHWAAAAATVLVGDLGGRPALSESLLRERLATVPVLD